MRPGRPRSRPRAGSRPASRGRTPRLPPPAPGRATCSRGLQGGQRHPEEGPASLPLGDRKLALVLPDDRMADREAEAGRVLGGEERLEDALTVSPPAPWPAVDHPLRRVRPLG